MHDRLGKWLLSWPPLVYLLVFFLIPSLIMMFARRAPLPPDSARYVPPYTMWSFMESLP